ncbi:hypothetical protein DMUE_3477 [Dictyocoela muelleri]|nr:hypothetical protein DMUE_3477 [Dictyocoela muelleri]
MNFSKEPINSRSEIFLSNNKAIEFLKYQGFLDLHMECFKCKGRMSIEHDVSYASDNRLRCRNQNCGKSKPLFQGLKMGQFQIDLFEYLFVIYSWLEKNYEYNISKNSNVSLSTIKRIKRQLIKVFEEENKTTWK